MAEQLAFGPAGAPVSHAPVMYAVTLWQPYAWAVPYGGKDIENRPWAPPAWLIGKRIAIHASAAVQPKYEREAAALILKRTGVVVPDPKTLVRGAVVAVATIDHVSDCRGNATADAILSRLHSWWLGPVGWYLRDVVALDEPVPCRGYQKLWRLEPGALAQVLARVERAEGASL